MKGFGSIDYEILIRIGYRVDHDLRYLTTSRHMTSRTRYDYPNIDKTID